MKKYNKIITLCLCVSLTFGITACGSRQDKKEMSKEAAKDTSKVTSKEESNEPYTKTSDEVSKEEPIYSNKLGLCWRHNWIKTA